MKSLIDIVNESVRQSFEDIVSEQIHEIELEAQKKIERVFEEARSEAKKMANKMTLELMQKVNKDGLSVEFKL